MEEGRLKCEIIISERWRQGSISNLIVSKNITVVKKSSTFSRSTQTPGVLKRPKIKTATFHPRTMVQCSALRLIERLFFCG